MRGEVGLGAVWVKFGQQRWDELMSSVVRRDQAVCGELMCGKLR